MSFFTIIEPEAYPVHFPDAPVSVVGTDIISAKQRGQVMQQGNLFFPKRMLSPNQAKKQAGKGMKFTSFLF